MKQTPKIDLSPGVIHDDSTYTLAEFLKRTGWTYATVFHAKNCGLRVRSFECREYIDGSDFRRFLATHSPDKVVIPECNGESHNEHVQASVAEAGQKCEFGCEGDFCIKDAVELLKGTEHAGTLLQVYTEAEAAECLRVTLDILKRERQLGRINFREIADGRIRYTQEDLDNYLDERSTDCTSPAVSSCSANSH